MKRRKNTRLPYEKAGERWPEYTRPYKRTIHHFMSLKERESWIRSPGISDLRIFSCGSYTEAWGHKWERKGIDEGVYIYCVAGRGHYRTGGRPWTIGPGELLYCYPKTHHEYKADSSDPWSIYWMHVSGKRAGLFERHIGVDRNMPVVRIGIVPDIVNLFSMLFTRFAAVNNAVNMLAIQSCAADILGSMAVASHSHRTAKAYTDEVNSALKFMEESISRPAGIADFARQAGVSPFHFCRIFKKATGMPPMNYFNQLKTRRACQLLAGSKLKIKEIAFQLGFTDQYYFSRLFKKTMGFPPEQYRHQ